MRYIKNKAQMWIAFGMLFMVCGLILWQISDHFRIINFLSGLSFGLSIVFNAFGLALVKKQNI